NGVRQVVDALDRSWIVALRHHALEWGALHNGLPDKAGTPTYRHAARINATLDGVQECGPIVAAVHVVFARPDDFDGGPGYLCDVNGFHHEVRMRIRAPAESSAEECGVDLCLLQRQSGDLRGVRPIHRLELRARPDLARISA